VWPQEHRDSDGTAREVASSRPRSWPHRPEIREILSAAYAIARDVPLRERNTLRVAATARHLATLHDADALPALLAEPALRGAPALVLGEGSNVLFATERFEGVIVQLAGSTARVLEEQVDDVALVRADAALRWDPFVDWTLARNLCGLENLALIPGHCGAAPIQNIGAYGVEVGESIATVEAYDRQTNRVCRLSRDACEFGYRDSLFKRDPERWIVTAVELRLRRYAAPNLAYAGIVDELAAMRIGSPTATDVANAVRRLRRRKLPDPGVIGNAGSFFKNPIVVRSVAAALAASHPGLPVFASAVAGSCKLSAAWLIERAGWRGLREGDAGISAQHALVLVNHGAATGAQLLSLARRVAASVQEKFGVMLEPEPRIVGARFTT